MGCWFYPNNATSAGIIMAMTDPGSGGDRLALIAQGNVGGDPLRLLVDEASTSTYDSSSGYSANTWHHALGVMTSSTQAVYLDGTNKGTGTDSYGSLTITDSYIGAWSRLGLGVANHFDGRITHAAFWDVALTDAEAALLGAGISPLFIRPQSLVAYYPLYGHYSPEVDYMGGQDMSVSGASGASVLGPPVYMPSSGIVIPGASGGGGGTPSDPANPGIPTGVSFLSGFTSI